MDYQIDHDPIDRGHLIVASGELDISATPRLSTVLAMAATSPGGRLVLDLDNVTFIDSTALGTILKAAAQLDEAGTLLAVVAPTSSKPNKGWLKFKTSRPAEESLVA